MVSKRGIRRFIKLSCIVQLINASIDYFLWFTTSFQVPSWTISTIVLFYSIMFLAYDRL